MRGGYRRKQEVDFEGQKFVPLPLYVMAVFREHPANLPKSRAKHQPYNDQSEFDHDSPKFIEGQDLTRNSGLFVPNGTLAASHPEAQAMDRELLEALGELSKDWPEKHRRVLEVDDLGKLQVAGRSSLFFRWPPWFRHRR